jgi:tRNA-intron lyase
LSDISNSLHSLAADDDRMFSWLGLGKRTRDGIEVAQATTNAELPSIQFQGVLKYNSVFVTDDSLQRLMERGFGAKRIRPIPAAVRQSKQAAAPRKEVDPEEEEEEEDEEEEEKGVANTVVEKEMEEEDLEEGTRGDEVEGKKIRGAKTPQSKKSARQREEEEFEDSGPLLLFDEEAFYLFEKRYLVLDTLEGRRVTKQQLWTKFLEKNKNFPLKYKVYCYFRNLGYIVKTGIHYGMDFAVYRTLPSMCHSEICAMIVDATQPFDVSEGLKGLPSTCQQSWRHISTLTRVMPDVMKLMTVCYVLPSNFVARGAPAPAAAPTSDEDEAAAAAAARGEEQQGPSSSPVLTNQDLLKEIFGGFAGSSAAAPALDFSSPAVLEQLHVRPVTTLVRRLPCKSDSYQTIGDVQKKYRSCSILKAPRVQQMSKKKRRKRRDHTEVRLKAASKHNKVWKQLMAPASTAATKPSANNDGCGGSDFSAAASISRSQEKKQRKKQKQDRKRAKSEAASASVTAAPLVAPAAAAAAASYAFQEQQVGFAAAAVETEAVLAATEAEPDHKKRKTTPEQHEFLLEQEQEQEQEQEPHKKAKRSKTVPASVASPESESGTSRYPKRVRV